MIATAPKPDTLTRRWIRDAADERAARAGCWFDEERGQFVVDWIYMYLRLYEGEDAGKPVEMCDDWQYDATMRLFGWVRHSEDWGRTVRRFTKAAIFVGKKNKKSPTLAAWTIYTAFGDGEMGQKCFPTAKNGKQIRENVLRHIHQMILQSEELSAECVINKSTGQVLHVPTTSIILPLSSENLQTQKANEGLNGSVWVDEVHVVDGEHIARVSRAGISRPEPLHVEVSTAGDEPESYGKARFDYAQGIINGTVKDDATLGIIYAAPQDLSDEVLAADPIKFGKMANPAWGHTVKQSEFLNDYETSKRSLKEFSKFKQYRLNIWQQSASPWLSVHDWAQCPASAGGLDEDAATFGGLDLSRTTDLTAWLLFQPGDVPCCYGHYWIPEERLQTLAEQLEIPILEWVREGWITVSGTRRIEFGDVSKRINEDAERFRQLRYVGYDRYAADPVLNQCRDDLGFEMVECAQGVATLSAPSKELERLVIGHQLDHSGDPVLAWMIGNTSIRTDENGNIKPVKTVGGNRKHIDGVVALIMAIHAATLHTDEWNSVYDTRGMLSL